MLRSGKSARQLGFKASDGDISRFLARFELAARYRQSDFEGYSVATARAYSALIGLLLAWGSFEQLGRICGLDTKATALLFDSHVESPKGRRSAAVTPLYRYLADRATSPSISLALRNASEGHPLGAEKLMRALRNAFVHGQLTAHTGGAMPKNLAAACSGLTEQLLAVQASHFQKMIAAGAER